MKVDDTHKTYIVNEINEAQNKCKTMCKIINRETGKPRIMTTFAISFKTNQVKRINKKSLFFEPTTEAEVLQKLYK